LLQWYQVHPNEHHRELVPLFMDVEVVSNAQVKAMVEIEDHHGQKNLNHTTNACSRFEHETEYYLVASIKVLVE